MSKLDGVVASYIKSLENYKVLYYKFSDIHPSAANFKSVRDEVSALAAFLRRAESIYPEIIMYKPENYMPKY